MSALVTRLKALCNPIAGRTTARRSRRGSLPAETLEVRMLPAATLTASLSKGVLTVEGTANNDVIVVHQNNGIAGSYMSIDNCNINVNGKLVSTVGSSSVTSIQINGLQGDDFISVGGSTSYDAVSIPATLWGVTAMTS
jgi:hypothetical protein